MKTLDILDQPQRDALHDKTLRQTLLETRTAPDPLRVFCRTCRELGYELCRTKIKNTRCSLEPFPV